MMNYTKIKERLQKRYDNMFEFLDIAYEIIEHINSTWTMEAFSSKLYEFEAKWSYWNGQYHQSYSSNVRHVSIGLKIRNGELQIVEDNDYKDGYVKIVKDDITYINPKSFLEAFEALMKELSEKNDFEAEKEEIKEILKVIKGEKK